MTRAPTALAFAVVSITSRSIAAEPCAPRAELDGEPAAVALVRDELGKLGVGIGIAGGGCRGVHARVQLDEGGALAVAIVDDSHRSEGRVVSDAALAAAWIDSWLRDDDLGGNWGVVRTAAAAERRDAPAVVARRSVLDRGALAIGYEQSFTGDPASWSGASATGCGAIGPVCVGARVRYGEQRAGDPSAPTDDRTELAALATVSAAFSVGKMAVVPELGLGIGRFRATRNGICKPTSPDGTGTCDPVTDPSCSPVCIDASGQTTGDVVSRTVDSYEPRAAAALRITVPLFDHVWLDALASLTVIPFAHTAMFLPDPKSVPANIDPSLYTLAGEPSTSVQLGIGLRVGVP